MSAALGLVTAAAAVATIGWADTVFALRRIRRTLRQAERDGLTGLWRRDGFEARAPDALAAGNVVALLDLDKFKDVNDTYGHPAGDSVLRATADRLTAQLGDTALLGRFGGDEFAVIAHLPPASMHEMLDALASVLTAEVPAAGDRAVGVSIGVARLDDLPAFADRDRRRGRRFWADVLAEGLAAADQAMYAAKRRHRGWRVFDPALDAPRPARALDRAPQRRCRTHGPAALAART